MVIKMKYFAKYFLFICLLSMSYQNIFCQNIYPIYIRDIISSTYFIQEIEVINYIEDTVLLGKDKNNHDTIHLDCRMKKFQEKERMQLNQFNLNKWNTNDSLWEGSFPKIGETIIILSYIDDCGTIDKKLLFAREYNLNMYRFWDPYSPPGMRFVEFPFAIHPEDTIYEIPRACMQGYYVEEVLVNSYKFFSEGFLINKIEFDKIREELNRKIKSFEHILSGIWTGARINANYDTILMDYPMGSREIHIKKNQKVLFRDSYACSAPSDFVGEWYVKDSFLIFDLKDPKYARGIKKCYLHQEYKIKEIGKKIIFGNLHSMNFIYVRKDEFLEN